MLSTSGEFGHVHPEMDEEYCATILKEAEAICSAQRVAGADSADVLYVRGLLALRNGQYVAALEHLREVVARRPGSSTHLANLGRALAQNGRCDEALSAFLEALRNECASTKPNLRMNGINPDLLCDIAGVLWQQERRHEALAFYDLAAKSCPMKATTQRALANAFRAAGRTARAIHHYSRAAELNPDDIDNYRLLARAYADQREWTQAIDCLRRGIERAPDCLQLHVDLGGMLLRAGALQEAASAFRTAVAIHPPDVEASKNLVLALELLQRKHEIPDAWCNYGLALENAGQFEPAAEAFHKALAKRPACLTAIHRLGWVHLRFAEPEKAKQQFEATLACEPQHAWAHVGLGQASHLLGDLQRGWSEFQWYSHVTTARNSARHFEQPVWDGSTQKDHPLLVWSDWFLGDTIQNIRHLKSVKVRVGKIIVECHRGLVPLVERIGLADFVAAKGTPLPPFHLQIPMSALPRVLAIRRETIPADVPYLSIDERLKAVWKQKVGAGGPERIVGIVWSGDAKRENASVRFTSLATFAGLATVPGARFVSLQLGAPASELLAPPRGFRVERILEESSTISDTAALVANLDLVISVDTMVAHLAGALAIPVWTLVPYGVDWRWHRNGDRSPWYPTMRMFRQPKIGDWVGAVEQMREALEAFAPTRGSLVATSAAVSTSHSL